MCIFALNCPDLPYLPLFDPKIPLLSIFSLIYLYFFFTTIYLCFAVFRLNYPYLGVFALNCPDFTICAIFTPYMHFSIENFFRAIGPLYREILHFEDLGDTSVVSSCSLGVNLVIDNLLYVASDSSPLYKI